MKTAQIHAGGSHPSSPQCGIIQKTSLSFFREGYFMPYRKLHKACSRAQSFESLRTVAEMQAGSARFHAIGKRLLTGNGVRRSDAFVIHGRTDRHAAARIFGLEQTGEGDFARGRQTGRAIVSARAANIPCFIGKPPWRTNNKSVHMFIINMAWRTSTQKNDVCQE